MDLININAMNCLKTDPNCHHNEIHLIDPSTYHFNLDPNYFIESLIKRFHRIINNWLVPQTKFLEKKKIRKKNFQF